MPPWLLASAAPAVAGRNSLRFMAMPRREILAPWATASNRQNCPVPDDPEAELVSNTRYAAMLQSAVHSLADAKSGNSLFPWVRC